MVYDTHTMTLHQDDFSFPGDEEFNWSLAEARRLTQHYGHTTNPVARDQMKSKLEKLCPNYYSILFDLLFGIIGFIFLFFFLKTVQGGNLGLLLLGIVGTNCFGRFLCKFQYRNRMAKLLKSDT